MLLQSMGIVVALSFRAIRFRPSELLSNDGLDVVGHVLGSVVGTDSIIWRRPLDSPTLHETEVRCHSIDVS